MSESENQVQAPEETPVPGPAPASESETAVSTKTTDLADSTPQPKGKKRKDPEQENSTEFNPAENNPPLAEEEEKTPEQSPDLTLSQMVLALPEHVKQSIHDTMVSYVHNKMERDTILHSVFQKAEKALVEEFNKN